jgi:tetratricopeptide (TPR) repeat protein/GNAT superfamily N-acetyltransferase
VKLDYGRTNEDWEDIKIRICQPDAFPKTFIVFDNTEQPNGGLVADFYPYSGVIHLIYIAVGKQSRGKGVAKTLIKKLLPLALQQIQEIYSFQNSAILFESNIPWRTKIDAIDPSTRLQIFESLGAKAIPIRYTQPALAAGKNEVDNLFLLSFPLEGMQHQSLETELIISFLNEFFIGLGIEEPTQNKTFVRMQNELLTNSQMNQVKLTAIPQLEKPQIRMQKAAVCVQFTSKDGANDGKDSKLCNEFYSYETDLLSAHFQKRRPFESQFQEQIGVLPITIHFPEKYNYLSEGRRHQRVSVRQEVSAKLHISRTRALNGNTSTWSVVISTANDGYFTELECIKLLNFFGSKQEDVQMIAAIGWSSATISKCLFTDFIAQLLSFSSQEPIEISSGILQTDTAYIDFEDASIEFEWSEFYLKLKHYNEHLELAGEEYERTYYNDVTFQAINNIFCGFALGIFDFERMDFDEVTDTLIPRKANENYLLLLNRGILLCACHDDDMFTATLDSIGISPYLLIPNMVLVNNEFTLNRIDQAIEQVNEGHEQKNKIALSELRKVRSEIDHWLNDNYLPNIFQYPTEKDLYEFGTDHRGILIYKANLENNIQTLDDLKDELIANRQENSDLMMTILLTLLSGIQFQSMFESFVDGDFVMSWVWTILFSLSLTGAIYYFTKLKTKG